MATGGNGSDEITNFKCCICAQKNMKREGERYCVECQDYFCKPCTDLHNMFPSAMGVHQLLDKTHFSQAGEKTLPCFPVERCTIHKAKLLDMYCADHNEVSCGPCVALYHSKCQNIHSVPDEVNYLYKKSAADETKEKLTATMINVEKLKKVKAFRIIELDKSKETATESIKDFRREIEAILENFESESIKELEAEYNIIKERLEHQTKEAEQYEINLKETFEKLNNSAGNKAHEFVSIKIAETNIARAREAESSLEKELDVNIVFIAFSKIKHFIEELKTFGTISVNKPLNEDQDKVYSVNNWTKINVKLGNDGLAFMFKTLYRSVCHVHGTCFTDDGLLILSDHENHKLKRVDLSSASVKDHLLLESRTLALCQTVNNEIAVNLCNSKVQFVSVGKKMAKIKQLKLDHYCWGLAYKDAKLYISDQHRSLYIYDLTGKLLRKITTDKLGNNIFYGCRHISFSSKGDEVYVVDIKKGLLTFDLQGNYKSAFTDPDFGQPEAVCTDGKGNIFVCGYGSSNIVQISEKPKRKMGVLWKLKDCSSISFDSRHNLIVVSQWESDTLNVFELR